MRGGHFLFYFRDFNTQALMLSTNSDQHWERFGRQDPYFGVLASEKFHRETLTPEAITEFFASGERRVGAALATIQRHFDPDFHPACCLDFGCGVGRLVIPLAKRFPHVVGVDISLSMLREAAQNCAQRGVENVQFVQSDDRLSKVEGKFDFIYSDIVFQHIPRPRGEKIVARLIDLLNDGGVAALSLPYSANAPLMTRCLRWAQKSVPLVHSIVNLTRGRRFDYPLMQSNIYQPDRIFRLLEEQGVREVYLRFNGHNRNPYNHLGLMVFAQKCAATKPR